MLVEDGIKWFFQKIIGKTITELKYWWEKKTGRRQYFEFGDIDGLIKSLESGEIEGISDVKIKKVCLSNFAPLYLYYPDTRGTLQYTIQKKAEEARALYGSLVKKYQIPDSSSLFMKAVMGKEVSLDLMFRQYVERKKFGFLGMSLARFEPLTKDLCYGALFKSGRKLKYHTAPLSSDVHLEPCIPLFYDASFPIGVEGLPYVDAEIYGRILPIPSEWASMLEKRGVRISGRPYCVYVPHQNPYSIDIVDLETSMSLDAWIVFSLKQPKLELPWYCRFEPTNDQSRKYASDFFSNIYRQLPAQTKPKIVFYSDYVRPFIKNVPVELNMKTIRHLVA